MDQLNVFLIKDTISGDWIVSSKMVYLGPFGQAAIFRQEANAIKAVKEMNKAIERAPRWYNDGEHVTSDQKLYERWNGEGKYVFCPPNFEIVPFTLTPKD